MKKKFLILLIIPFLVVGCKDEGLLEKTTRAEDVLVVTADPGKSVSRTSSHTPVTNTTADEFGTLPSGKTTKKTTTKAGNKTTTTTKKNSSTNKTITIKVTKTTTTGKTNKLSLTRIFSPI